jgi:thiamine biosynthesis lipoprotein
MKRGGTMNGTRETLSRRQFVQIVALGGTAGLARKLGLDRLRPPAPVRQACVLLGTTVHLSVAGGEPQAAQAAIDATWRRMARLEALLSHRREESQLSLLNREGCLERAAPPLLDLLAQARQISELSGGAFDVTVQPLVDLYRRYRAQGATPPAAEIRATLERVDYRRVLVEGLRVTLARPGTAVTLDGIAKGYILDRGIETLRAYGYADVLVEAGGDLHATRQGASFEPWPIGVQSPFTARPGLLARLHIHDGAVATSGDGPQPYPAGLRQRHVLDPRTGDPGSQLAGVTVAAPTAMLADALVTAVMVLGPTAGRALVDRFPGCTAYLVSKDADDPC